MKKVYEHIPTGRTYTQSNEQGNLFDSESALPPFILEGKDWEEIIDDPKRFCFSLDSEEVKEKEWEITSFRRCYGGMKLGLIVMFRGKWTGAEGEIYRYSTLIDSKIEIYSVK